MIYWFHTEETQPDIKPPVYRFTGFDEALRTRTKARREAAERIRARAARVDSGAPISAVLQLASRRVG